MKHSILDGTQSLYFQSGKERSPDFALSFSERAARPYVIRLTGGCALMTSADAVGMKNLTDALRGKVDGRLRHPRFAGFALFGGTRMRSIHDPKVIVPGITEIFPAMAKDSPGLVMLGMIPNFQSVTRSKSAVSGTSSSCPSTKRRASSPRFTKSFVRYSSCSRRPTVKTFGTMSTRSASGL